MKVSVTSDRGMLRLRWTYAGKRYSLNLGLEDTRANNAYANGIARQIQDDGRCGQFDPSLNRYRPKTIGHTGITACELFRKFAAQKEKDGLITARSLEVRYEPLAIALKHWLDVPAHEVNEHKARDFISIQMDRVTARTAKERVWLLKSCWDWAIENNLISGKNPWVGLAETIKPQPKQKVKPFTKAEIQAILEAFKTHPQYCHYSEFITFLFNVGCRFGEAAGLQWKHFGHDFETVWIGESISRGSRKTTKTGKARTVVLSAKIQVMLKSRFDALYPDPEDLVFPSPKNKAICDRNFRNRAWKTILEQCHIEYRKPYAVRHSVISHALYKGADPIAIAEQTGHDKRVLLETYAHAIDQQSVFVEF